MIQLLMHVLATVHSAVRKPALLAVSGLALAFQPLLSIASPPHSHKARLAFVNPGFASTVPSAEKAFWQRLEELGWIEGKNLVVLRRFAQNRDAQLPAIMREVLSQNVDVIVTPSTPSAKAAQSVTTTVPIVAPGMGDPVGSGLVRNLAHPGGNLTGISMHTAEELPGKWIELLDELVPNVASVAVIFNPGNPISVRSLSELQHAAANKHIKIESIEATDMASLPQAFERAHQRNHAIVLVPDSIYLHERQKVAQLGMRSKIAAIYGLREFTEAGGLLSYGPDLKLLWRRGAELVDRILTGAKPADLPIEQPTKFELVINLKTAKALGITIPESILLRADEVIR